MERRQARQARDARGRRSNDAHVARQILVVDDETTIRESLVQLLRQYGYTAIGAMNGRDALSKLRSEPERWSAILLDWMMPIMDGRSFRQAQRRDPEVGAIPVIVISACRDAALHAEELALEACLTKPPDMMALLEIVARVHRRSP